MNASRREELAYFLLRVTTGLMFSFHGMQKILGVFGHSTAKFPSQMWFGGLIEMVCGLLVAAGVFTRVAAFLASGTMAVAYVQFHWKLQMGPQFLPGLNDGEHSLLYAFIFLFIAARGAGIWALGLRARS
jgi:putative oxidoreductase